MTFAMASAIAFAIPLVSRPVTVAGVAHIVDRNRRVQVGDMAVENKLKWIRRTKADFRLHPFHPGVGDGEQGAFAFTSVRITNSYRQTRVGSILWAVQVVEKRIIHRLPFENIIGL